MKIRSKLLSAIGLNLLLIFAVISVVYVNVQLIERAFEDVAGTTTPAIIHLHSMNESFYSSAYNTLAYAMAQDREARQAFDDGMSRFDQHKNELMALVQGGNTVAPEDDQMLLARINVAEANFMVAARQLFAHLEAEGALFVNHDETNFARDIHDIQAMSDTIGAVAEPLREWIEMERAEVVEAQEAVHEAVNRTLLLVFGLGGIALFLIVLSNGWVVYIISRPLRILQSTAQAITAGNLAAQATVTTHDEFGELAGTFNEMTGKLRQAQAVLEKQVKARTAELEILKTDLEKQVKVRTAELESLKVGLEKTVEERTADLKNKMSELERMNQMMTGRELKMVEMKRELEQLRGMGAVTAKPLARTRKIRLVADATLPENE